MFFFFVFDEDKVETTNGNKGEWSEPYVLLKLLSDGRLYAADENLKKLNNIYFPILKIFREEKTQNKDKRNLSFQIIKETESVKIFEGDKLIANVEQTAFNSEAEFLYDFLINYGKDKEKEKTPAFEIERTMKFLNSIGCYKLKASSTDKSDISVQLHDINTGYESICGFSIKSRLGNPSTLINAGEPTNFVYEISNLDKSKINEINSIETTSKILDRIKMIKELGGELSFSRMYNQVYENNVMFIDSSMPLLLSYAVLYSYSENITNCKELITYLEAKNPLHFPNTGHYYEYKFKKFLCSAALGMMPGKPWEGKDEANGGYIIVCENGDVLAYHIYNRDKFEDYLLYNTKFERASTTRHNYASIYEENGRLFMNLNLQIRFIK